MEGKTYSIIKYNKEVATLTAPTDADAETVISSDIRVNFTRYLARIMAGETFHITKHKKNVATISPPQNCEVVDNPCETTDMVCQPEPETNNEPVCTSENEIPETQENNSSDEEISLTSSEPPVTNEENEEQTEEEKTYEEVNQMMDDMTDALQNEEAPEEPEPIPVLSVTDLKNMTKNELLEKAQSMNLEVFKSWTNIKIKNAILAAR